jgi:hypothetical protein
MWEGRDASAMGNSGEDLADERVAAPAPL